MKHAPLSHAPLRTTAHGDAPPRLPLKVRGIATEAAVDPALVLHYFGSKHGVFRAAIDFPVDPTDFVPRLLAPGLEGLGERLVRFFLETWDAPAGSPGSSGAKSVSGSGSGPGAECRASSRDRQKANH